MSSPVLEAARAEREQLEERCAWHRGQLDRLVVAVGGGPAGDTVALQAGADEPLAVAVSDDADPDVPAVGSHAARDGTDSRILFRGAGRSIALAVFTGSDDPKEDG